MIGCIFGEDFECENFEVEYWSNDPKFRGGTYPPKHIRIQFENGYGASIIAYGMGAEEGLYELAVLDYEGHCIFSDVPLSDEYAEQLDDWGVLGCLTHEKVLNILTQLKNLRE